MKHWNLSIPLNGFPDTGVACVRAKDGLSIPLNGFLTPITTTPCPLSPQLSIPLNGFGSQSTQQSTTQQLSFNSIEWIRGCLSPPLISYSKPLSIPLNGFLPLVLPFPPGCWEPVPFNSIEWIHKIEYDPGEQLLRIGFFQFHWMDFTSWNTLCVLLFACLSIPLNGFTAVDARIVREAVDLSIPLNGFCTITAYVVCGNFSISIHMDSIQLSPREGASWL